MEQRAQFIAAFYEESGVWNRESDARQAILLAVRSRSAETVAQIRAERLAAMTPAERVGLALELAEDGLAAYISTHGVDRPTAIAQIKQTRRLGRRRSACAEADAP